MTTRDTRPRAARRAHQDPTADAPGQILIVDDDAELRGLAAIGLRRAGMDTVDAASGEDALRLLETISPDVVLLDLHMSGMTGLDVIRTLRRRRETATLPIIVMTGSGDDDALVSALGLGADDFLAKPFRLDELVARVQAHMRAKTAWGAELESALRSRADIVRALSDVALPSDSVEAAVTVVSEIGRSTDIEFVSLLQLVGRRSLASLASFSRQGGVIRGGALSAARSRYLLEATATGPVVQQVPVREPDEPIHVFWSLGLEAAAAAPLHWAGQQVGLLALGVGPGRGGTPIARGRLLAATIDYANLLSAVVGSVLAVDSQRVLAVRRLRRILERREFFPVYQPIVRVADRATVGFEALTRFVDHVLPSDRFAEAASSGLGLEFEVATLVAAMERSALLPPSEFISVNVSPDLLAAFDRVASVLGNSDRPVVLELTEHVAISDYAAFRQNLDRRATKLQIAVDDTGAGYAGLRHILELHPSFVKLDISIVRGIETDPVRQALVAGLERFGSATGCRIIAEGVETEAELATLRGLGIELVQGFLLGRPEPLLGDLTAQSHTRAKPVAGGR